MLSIFIQPPPPLPLSSWRPLFIVIRDFKNRQRGGLENATTESGAGASTAY